MNVNASRSAGWSAYSAWTEVRTARARLSADLAAGASPQVIAADRSTIASSGHRLAVQAGRIDVLV